MITSEITVEQLKNLFPAEDDLTGEHRQPEPVHQRETLVGGELKPGAACKRCARPSACAKVMDRSNRSNSRSTDRHVRFVWQLRRTPERDCSELDGRARACLEKPAAPAYVGSCSRRKRASSCPSHSRRSADETSTTAVHGRDQVQPQTVAGSSMAISSVSGQTSTGGPSRPSRANQPDSV